MKKGISLEISPGEVVVALVPSGSGKTTLLRIIAGLEIPDEGEVHVRGTAATHFTPQQRGLGVVFQEHALFQRKTVAENIAFGLQMQGKLKDERQSAVSRLLALTHLEAHRQKYPTQLLNHCPDRFRCQKNSFLPLLYFRQAH